jgi:PAS domain S-box-containing protein
MSEANRDRIAGGTIVLRDQRVVYATVGAQALLGRSGRGLLGLELAELVAPEDRERVLDRHERRLRGEPVPSEYEMQLLRPDGSRRTTEARVSLEGTEVVIQLQDLTDQADRRRRLEGLAALGVAIQRERSEPAIHERVREGLAALDLTPALLRPAGDGVQVVWARLPAAIAGAVAALLKRPIEGLIGPWSAFSREAWSAGSAYSDDWVAHAAQFARQEQAGRVAAAAAALGLVRGLAVRLDQRLGPTGYLLAVGEWVRSSDLPAFRLFGAQVAAALDSARDIAELSARNVELSALAELGALSGTAASLDEFLPPALDVVLATTGGQAAGVFAVAQAQRQLELVHATGLGGPPPRLISRAGFDSPLGEVASHHRLVVTHLDVLSPEQRAWAESARLSTFAFVPLVARTQTLGVLVVAWHDRLEEGACRPELLRAMASHLAAAMESQVLLRDLRRRVGELTLLNDVAEATASLDPVLLLDNALRRICETFEADGGLAYLSIGDLLEQQATLGLPAESAALLRRLDAGEGPAGQAVARR